MKIHPLLPLLHPALDPTFPSATVVCFHPPGRRLYQNVSSVPPAPAVYHPCRSILPAAHTNTTSRILAPYHTSPPPHRLSPKPQRPAARSVDSTTPSFPTGTSATVRICTVVVPAQHRSHFTRYEKRKRMYGMPGTREIRISIWKRRYDVHSLPLIPRICEIWREKAFNRGPHSLNRRCLQLHPF